MTSFTFQEGVMLSLQWQVSIHNHRGEEAATVIMPGEKQRQNADEKKIK